MSILTKIGLVLLAILLASTLILSKVGLSEYKKVALQKKQMTDLQAELKATQLAAKREQKIQSTTNEVIAKATLQTRQTTLKAKEISHKVDIITGKVKNDQISVAVADAEYAASMLEAYCQAVPTDRNKCHTR